MKKSPAVRLNEDLKQHSVFQSFELKANQNMESILKTENDKAAMIRMRSQATALDMMMVKQEGQVSTNNMIPSLSTMGPMMLTRLETFNKEIRDKHWRIHKQKQERREEARKRK